MLPVVGRSILIAHDDPAVAAGLSIFLQGRGFQCDTARDPEQVLRLLALSKCDVVLYGGDLDGAPTADLSRRLARGFPGVVALPLDGDGVRREGDGPPPPLDYESVLRRIREAFATPAGGEDGGAAPAGPNADASIG